MQATRSVVAAGLVISVAATAHAQRAWRTPGETDAATARRLSSIGRCDEALAPFDAAIESRSGEASLRRDRGACHERLGHPAPAIEDYRAYLSMEPSAPDAASIKTRLDALEAGETTGGSLSASTETAPPLPESDRETTPTKRGRPSGVPDPGDFSLGFHVGAHVWSPKGYAVATVGYGLAASYTYATALELDARVLLLQTNVLHTGGFGAVVDNTFKVGLDSDRRWELGLALGVGIERQSNEFRIPRNYFFGHVNPKVRFSITKPLMLEAGPELGIGLMDQETQPTGETPTALTLSYGGYLRLAWVIRGS
jgi:hypothetical protein